MTSEYNRPRQRARSIGAGILTGAAATNEGIMKQVQSNIQFRLQSLRDMVSGQGGQTGLSPIERRQEIRQRRQSIIGAGSSSTESSTGSTGVKRTSPSRGSGSIGRTGTASSDQDSTTVQSHTPSMSEVDKGTRARAMDLGFED